MSINSFYDKLAVSYHLIFEDWDASMMQQGETLSAIIRDRWGSDVRTVLDVACGIGTQAIALAQQGYQLTASDISSAAVGRAEMEARARGVRVEYSACDIRHCLDHHRGEFDLVMACDNSVPHLLTDAEILAVLRQMHAFPT